MEESINEEKVTPKMSVNEMSKIVCRWIIIMLIIFSAIDIVKSGQNGEKPWIGRYMEENYPRLLKGLFSTGSSKADKSDKSDEADEPENNSPFDSNGFIFPNSDSHRISEEKLYELKNVDGYDFEELLGFARNEIYARHGFKFKADGKYYAHYSQYKWYRKMDHGDVADSDLNMNEIENINLIVSIETREGFR